MKGLNERYVITDRHQQRTLYDHAIADPAAAIRETALIWTRGLPTGYTRRNLAHFGHLEYELNPTRRPRCGCCEQREHKANTGHRVEQVQAATAAPLSVRPIDDITLFDPLDDAVNAILNIELLMSIFVDNM